MLWRNGGPGAGRSQLWPRRGVGVERADMVSREAQDRWALLSQQRFSAAQEGGHFKSQIVPVEARGKKGPAQFNKDEHNRPDTKRWRNPRVMTTFMDSIV